MECKFGSLTISGTLDRYDPERKIIRDWKTSGQIERIERDIENTFDYAIQMAFYYMLVFVNEGIECDVYLDILSKSDPYSSLIYRLTGEKLKRKMVDEIKPALMQLASCHDQDIWPLADNRTQHVMDSPYYAIMRSSEITEIIDSN